MTAESFEKAAGTTAEFLEFLQFSHSFSPNRMLRGPDGHFLDFSLKRVWEGGMGAFLGCMLLVPSDLWYLCYGAVSWNVE